ncbi:MAG TPA: 4-hydroxy-tetrahydrodipicolinate reductase [Actinomycetota bacterium]|nr:4-hydroxy-tetrahydrodipicolinate reductase [Actinomycetota bacterium]
MIRVGVFGAGGRMGAEVCRAVAAAGDMALAAAVDPGAVGRPVAEVAGVPGAGLIVSGDPAAMAAAGVEVAVDFTIAPSAVPNIHWCIDHGVHAVVGTSGIPPAEVEALPQRLKEAGARTGVFIAPNFAIGAVMMMRFARLAARWMPDAEIIEAHHASKRDSPSGTAMATVHEIAAGRTEARMPSADRPAETVEVLASARGGDRDGVHVHSVRLPGVVANQEVVFGAPGQTLTISHVTTDRVAFMPGVLIAIRQIGSHPGLTVGLEHFLGL